MSTSEPKTTAKTKEAAKEKAKAAPVESVEVSHEEAAHKPSFLASEYTWITLSFIITIVLIMKYLMPMINKGLDARAATIRDQLEQATRLRTEAQELLAHYQREQEARLKEAEEILICAKRDAADLRRRSAEELKQAMERRSQQAQEKIARAEAEAIAQIRTQVIETAAGMASDLLASQLQSEKEDPAIGNAIAAIGRKIA
jgi:F-type H+-transporting ATPase subunit b